MPVIGLPSFSVSEGSMTQSNDDCAWAEPTNASRMAMTLAEWRMGYSGLPVKARVVFCISSERSRLLRICA